MLIPHTETESELYFPLIYLNDARGQASHLVLVYSAGW